ncbi:MAG: hypothetical protein LH606_02970 [Cytophagaceae bacterium]|nr:hypothetical protein [Cytophagaceae bacterium]
MGYDFRDAKTSLNSTLTKRIGTRSTFEAGFYLKRLHFNVIDSILREPPLYPVTRWERRWDYAGGAWQIQPFVQWKYRASERLTLTAGLNAVIFTLNQNSRGRDSGQWGSKELVVRFTAVRITPHIGRYRGPLFREPRGVRNDYLPFEVTYLEQRGS